MSTQSITVLGVEFGLSEVREMYTANKHGLIDPYDRLVVLALLDLIDPPKTCPFVIGGDSDGILPEDPCPVCGDLGTVVVFDTPSRCISKV